MLQSTFLRGEGEERSKVHLQKEFVNAEIKQFYNYNYISCKIKMPERNK
jgi:hypothetical protein